MRPHIAAEGRRGHGPRPGSALLTCSSCQGRVRLLAVVKNPVSIARYLAAAGALTDVRSRALGDAARPTGSAACSAVRRWVTSAMKESTAEVTRQPKKRRVGPTRAKHRAPRGVDSSDVSRSEVGRAHQNLEWVPRPPTASTRSCEWTGEPRSFHLRSEVMLKRRTLLARFSSRSNPAKWETIVRLFPVR